MDKAIKCLEARIERLNKEMVEVQSRIDEPEMLCDYEFAINDMANLETEVIELQSAIKKLLV